MGHASFLRARKGHNLKKRIGDVVEAAVYRALLVVLSFALAVAAFVLALL